MYSTTRLYSSERYRSQDFGLKDKRLSSKRVHSCYIRSTLWMEFAIAKFTCSHIRAALDIIVYFKGFAFAAHRLCNHRKTDSHSITWFSFFYVSVAYTGVVVFFLIIIAPSINVLLFRQNQMLVLWVQNLKQNVSGKNKKK